MSSSAAAAAGAADDDDDGQRRRQPLPADPDWLSGVISRLIGRPKDAVTVLGDRTVATPAVSDPHNVLSSIVAVHIVYTVDGVPGTDTLDVVVKSLPQEPYSRAFVLEAQFDYREVHFYNTVGPALFLSLHFLSPLFVPQTIEFYYQSHQPAFPSKNDAKNFRFRIPSNRLQSKQVVLTCTLFKKRVFCACQSVWR